MRPAVPDQDMHLVDEAEHAGLRVAHGLLLPLLHLAYDPVLDQVVPEQPGRPGLDPVHPQAAEDGPGRDPAPPGVGHVVGLLVVTDPDPWVQIHTQTLGEGVVGVDEATLGAFKMMGGQGVGNGPEAELCR